MNKEELKFNLMKLNEFIYIDDNNYLREKCSDESLLKNVIKNFEAKIDSQTNDHFDDMIFLYGNIGNLYRIRGDTNLAIKSLKIALELSDGNKQISNLIRLGEALRYDGQHEQALNKFDEAIELCTPSNGSNLLDFAYQHKGKCLLELGQISLALVYFQAAMKIRLVKGDQSLIDSTQKAINYVVHALGQ
ncbi:tetratricopeptide repeat protein [Psychrobacillus sp. NPDC058041]|uniref:tetratricopeptide repeat protein n=1 Tax=Psychrobacillus sp. NPDC058041 TaxID=3346310 RepID=UPI0036DC7BF0